MQGAGGGVPIHSENEKQHSLGDKVDHEHQFREHYSVLVHFSLIFVIAFDSHVGLGLLCFPFLHVSL